MSIIKLGGCQHVSAGATLTREVVHETGLGGYYPLGPCLAADSDVAFGLLAQRGESATERRRCLESLLIGEPLIVPEDHLQGGTEQRQGLRVTF